MKALPINQVLKCVKCKGVILEKDSIEAIKLALEGEKYIQCPYCDYNHVNLF